MSKNMEKNMHILWLYVRAKLVSLLTNKIITMKSIKKTAIKLCLTQIHYFLDVHLTNQYDQLSLKQPPPPKKNPKKPQKNKTKWGNIQHLRVCDMDSYYILNVFQYDIHFNNCKHKEHRVDIVKFSRNYWILFYDNSC